jgi:TRAP-type C4-dicarboxylate transport system substrate-binding protein
LIHPEFATSRIRFLLWAVPLFFLLSSSILNATERLTTITFSQRDTVWTRNFNLFADEVRRASRDEVRFRYAGGPEAIPPFEQIEAVRRGVVQVALLPAAYFVSFLPEADAMKLSPYLPWEERQNGIHAFYDKLMQERLNVLYLGRLSAGIRYHFYFKKAVKDADFSGLKIRVTPIYEPFVRSLKGSPVTMAASEVYVALERGVIDGLGWPSIGFADLGWHEVVGFVMEPGFYQTDVCVLINLDAWKRLSPPTQELLRRVMEKTEKESFQSSAKTALEERRLLTEKGLKVVRLEEPLAGEYLGLAAKSAWDRILARCPENGPILKKLMEPRVDTEF